LVNFFKTSLIIYVIPWNRKSQRDFKKKHFSQLIDGRLNNQSVFLKMKRKILLFSEVKKISQYLNASSELKNFDFIEATSQTEFLEHLPFAEILLTDMTPFLSSNIHKATSLKWTQSTYAGVDGFFKTPFVGEIPKFILTKFGGKFGKIMTEYCLQHILNHERHFEKSFLAQKNSDWSAKKTLKGFF
jgi:phosphoglycerate dehydrogenase-like enzyme